MVIGKIPGMEQAVYHGRRVVSRRNVYQVELSTLDMATSVKMDEETKSRLERLQAKVKLETDRRVTQQEILARLVERAVESESDLVDSFREQRVPVSETDRTAFHDETVASGRETAEDDIDDVLYG
jgi:uncharacterized protein (DUF342 family)